VLAGRKSLGDAVDGSSARSSQTLQHMEFNQTRAAEMLGTTRPVLSTAWISSASTRRSGESPLGANAFHSRTR
jgi:hypothetical protein